MQSRQLLSQTKKKPWDGLKKSFGYKTATRAEIGKLAQDVQQSRPGGHRALLRVFLREEPRLHLQHEDVW